MKFSELKGKPVVAVNVADKLGTVDDVYLDLGGQQMIALRVSLPGLFSGHRVIQWAGINAIGNDAVTVHDGSVLEEQKAVAGLDGAPESGALLGSRIMTAGGSEVGTVSDWDFDTASGKIQDYVLSTGLLERMQHKEQVIPVQWVQTVNKGMIVVRDDAPVGSAEG